MAANPNPNSHLTPLSIYYISYTMSIFLEFQISYSYNLFEKLFHMFVHKLRSVVLIMLTIVKLIYSEYFCSAIGQVNHFLSKFANLCDFIIEKIPHLKGRPQGR